MNIPTEDGPEELALNLTPMIDVVFLLIIFFMVSTTFLNLEKEMDLNLPEAASGRVEEMENDELIISDDRETIYMSLPERNEIVTLTIDAE